MDQYGPSFEEVMSFHSNIAMPLQPHFVISFARRLSNKFERSIQIGLPTGVGLSLQYGNNNSRYMGAFSADGSVQGEYSHFFSKHLRGSIMGMVSPAPDSLKTNVSLNYSDFIIAWAASSDLHSGISCNFQRRFELMDIHQSLGVSYSLQDTSSMEEPGSSDTITGGIAHSYVKPLSYGVFIGANTYQTHKNTFTVSGQLVSNTRPLSIGVSVKSSLDEKTVTGNISGNFEVPGLPLMVSLGAGTDKSCSVGIMGMASFCAVRLSGGYQNGSPIGGISVEVMEN